MRYLSYALSALVLSGCLLKQTDPAPPPSPKGYLLGAVTMEEMYIANQGDLAVLTAQFAIKPVAKPAPVPVTATLTTAEGRQAAVSQLLGSEPTRRPACEKVKVDKHAATAGPKEAAVPLERVSVGPLGFGPVLQQSLLVLKGNDKNVYQTALQPGVPAGTYVVVSDGTPDVDPFNELLSVPEDVRNFRINGRDFGDVLIDFRPANNLEMSWREPLTNDMNGILFEVIAEDADYIYDMNCALREYDIPTVSGGKSWTLDAAWFAEFPRSGKVNFYFMRSHLRVSETKHSKVQLQGSRTFYSHLDVN